MIVARNNPLIPFVNARMSDCNSPDFQFEKKKKLARAIFDQMPIEFIRANMIDDKRVAKQVGKAQDSQRYRRQTLRAVAFIRHLDEKRTPSNQPRDHKILKAQLEAFYNKNSWKTNEDLAKVYKHVIDMTSTDAGLRRRKYITKTTGLKFLCSLGEKYTNEVVFKLFDRCSTQQWPGIVSVKFSTMGRGVVSTQHISKDDIVADYCGVEISGKTGEEYFKETGRKEYVFTISRKKHIDATDDHCEMHEGFQCLGRLLNHKTMVGDPARTVNITPRVISFNASSPFGEKEKLFFVASRDIEPFEQLRYDYGDVTARDLFTE